MTNLYTNLTKNDNETTTVKTSLNPMLNALVVRKAGP